MNEVFLLPYGFKLISQLPTLYLLQPQQHYQSTNIYSTKHIKKTYLWTAAQLLLSSSKGYKKISRFYVYATIVYPPALMILFPFSIEDLVQDALAVSVSGPYPMLFPDILLLCVNGLVPYSLAYRILFATRFTGSFSVVTDFLSKRILLWTPYTDTKIPSKQHNTTLD